MYLTRSRDFTSDTARRFSPTSAPSGLSLASAVLWLISSAVMASVTVGGLFACGYRLLTVPAAEAPLTQQKMEMMENQSKRVVFKKEIAPVRPMRAKLNDDMIPVPAQTAMITVPVDPTVLQNEPKTKLPPEITASAVEFDGWLARGALHTNPGSPDRAAVPRDAAPTLRKQSVSAQNPILVPPEKHFSSRHATLTASKKHFSRPPKQHFARREGTLTPPKQ
jgi:hypothetical protein